MVNGNVDVVRHCLTAKTMMRPLSSEEHHHTDDRMSLVMLAARHGQLYLLCNSVQIAVDALAVVSVCPSVCLSD